LIEMASLRISGTTGNEFPTLRTSRSRVLGSKIRRTGSLVLIVCTGTLAASSAQDQGDLVVIEGGPDHSGHVYTWTVTNQHDSPIVEIEFPHFRADLFTAPEGWRQETTFLVNIGVAEKEGVCKAIAPSPAGGIAPGQSSAFSMRVAAKGAQRGFATVTVRFADDTTKLIENVPLPQREAVLTRFMGLLGLGGVLVIVILVRSLRRGRNKKPGAPERKPAEAS